MNGLSVSDSEIQPQLRVAYYLRVSTDDQADKYGLDLQKEALNGLIRSKGQRQDGTPKMKLLENHIYIDEGISGTTELEERPGFAKLKEDIVMAPVGQLPFDIVAVYKIDRFARRLKILLNVIDFFEKHGVQFLSANESIDTSTPFGKAILGIIGVIAELEIETTRLRTQGGREEAIKKGVMMGAIAPYGYKKTPDKTLEIFEEEARHVRSIFEMFVNEGLSSQKIADYLTNHGVLSPEASAVINQKRKGEIKKLNSATFWRSETVRDVLGDRLYVGDYFYGKTKDGKRLPQNQWKLSPYKYPAIINNIVLFEKAQRLLEQSKAESNSRRRRDEHIYLLSGLLKCDCCKREVGEQTTWTGSRDNLGAKGEIKRYSYSYICGKKNRKKFSIICPTIPIPASPLELYVVEFTKKLLSNPVAVYNHQQRLKSTRLEIESMQKKKDELVKLLNALPQRMNLLKEQHEHGHLDVNTLDEKIKVLKNNEKEYQQEVDTLTRQISENILSESYIKTLDLFSARYKSALGDIYADREQIYEILHLLIEKIIIYSRPVIKKDVIAGKKRPNQYIPQKLEIKLKLPQDILQELVQTSIKGGFDVKDANL